MSRELTTTAGAVERKSNGQERYQNDNSYFEAAGHQVLADKDTRQHEARVPETISSTTQEASSGVIPIRQPVNYGAYESADAIWRHPVTGALLFVGDKIFAHSAAALAKAKVSRIVYCQGTDGSCPFENDAAFRYLNFPIGEFRSRRDHLELVKGGDSTLRFFDPLFAFVGFEMARGNNVLIHCLAGAHRAGTCGVACLMHFFYEFERRGTGAVNRVDKENSASVEAGMKPGWHTHPLRGSLEGCGTTPGAVTYARGRRPIINPAGHLPALLVALERTLAGAPLPSPRSLQKEMVSNFNFAC